MLSIQTLVASLDRFCRRRVVHIARGRARHEAPLRFWQPPKKKPVAGSVFGCGRAAGELTFRRADAACAVFAA